MATINTYITMDSFGTECPENWQEIAANLNRRIDEALTAAGETPEYGELSDECREIVDGIWERFTAGELANCPAPIFKEEKMYEITFEAGTSRHGSCGVNLMICPDDHDLYAEIAVPEDASDDYGYFNLKEEIIRKATAKGIPASQLVFWYDGMELYLEEDARV